MKTLQEKKEVWKRWIARNAERYKKSHKKWAANNRELLRAYSREHYWRKKEKNIKSSFERAQHDREQFQKALLTIMERMFFKTYPVLSPTTEPEMRPCYKQQICHCGQIFYTEGEIPKHICNNQLTEIKKAS